MGGSLLKSVHLAACVGVALSLLVSGCIVQTGTRPAVVEDSGEADGVSADGDAAGGGSDAGDFASDTVDAAKDEDGPGHGGDADAAAGDTDDTGLDAADGGSTQDVSEPDSTGGATDSDTAGVDDTSGAVDGATADTGDTEQPESDVSAPMCAPGSPGECDDGDACTVDSCHATLGCLHAALDCQDGNPCTNDTCSAASGCAHVNNTKPCDDGDACTTGEICGNGNCSSGKALVCNDGNPCTLDGCDVNSGCTHEDAWAKCDDGDLCTLGDACSGGTCQPGLKVACDDGNPCTDDDCDPVGGCDTFANAVSCKDGDPCTPDDACANKACVGGAADPCDDGNPCTDDSCDDGCSHAPNGAVCDDGDPCTTGDVCKFGGCSGTPMVCDDGDPCTVGDACADGGCVPGPMLVCDDGDPCTVGDSCVGGDCVPGPLMPCDDGDPCTAEACHPGSGTCVVAPFDGAPCDAGGGAESGMCADAECVLAQCGNTKCPALPGYGRSCNGAVCRYARLDQTEAWHAHDVWVWVPPGSFTMGSPDLDDAGRPEERPAHVVTLAYGFFVHETEVTVAVHEACEAAGGCSAPMEGANVNGGYPQNGIGRQQAEDVCAWLGGRLPTEAEWEYAANGPGMHRTYPWGDAEPSCAKFDGTAVFKGDPLASGCLEEGTSPTGSKPAGAAPTGVVDAAGNVAEWVEDCYHGTYESAPADGNAWSQGCGNFGVVRGGSYQSEGVDVRTASRAALPVAQRSLAVGARCVRTLEPRCAGVTCPHLDGYEATCNAMDHCEYERLELAQDWQKWDVWIYVPPGSFAMGSPESEEGHQPSEEPVHPVTFARGFFIGKHEIVVSEYEACMGEGSCTVGSTTKSGAGWGLNRTSNGRASHPQNGLTWQQSRTFCGWVAPGGRLPSEAEWEYVAAGREHRKYPWGDAPEPTCGNETAVFNAPGGTGSDGHGCNSGGTWPAGSMIAGPSAVGALDMAGNVWEWVEDCWHTNYSSAPTDGTAWTTGCSTLGRHKRGGGFAHSAALLRSAWRDADVPDYDYGYNGARCARPLPHTCGTTQCPVLGGYEVSCNVANHCEYRRFAPSEPWHAWDVWIHVPPGSFPMGCPGGSETCVSTDEQPVHTVTFATGHLIAKYEIVVSQYEACQSAGTCTAASTADWTGNGWGTNTSANGRATHPQNGLTWQQAKDFCEWVAPAGRLPTEAEWEYAATGPTHRKYPWGDSPEPTCTNGTAVFNEFSMAASWGCGSGGTWSAESKSAGASARGVLNMAGNVWEWVEDCSHESYTGAPTDGSAWTMSCSVPYRVCRGGGFNYSASGIRVAQRAFDTPGWRMANRGARCARDICLTDTDCDDGNDLTCDACNVGVCHHDSCMVDVPAGPFWMGCNAVVDTECEEDEKPQHEVTLSAYQIDEMEATVAAYKECVTAGECLAPSASSTCSPSQYGTYGAAGKDQHPVNCIGWGDAQGYCTWAKKRLCTEAEWEKAARGGCEKYPGQTCSAVMPKYPWGNAAASCSYAVYNPGSSGCGTDSTWAVGSKPAGASPYGALDMAGNVWEWVADWHGNYTSAADTNPPGPGSGSTRGYRGGTYDNGAFDLRASSRQGYSPSGASVSLGIRCCRSIP